MNEAEARAWLVNRLLVSRETVEKLARFVELISHESQLQNLVSASTWNGMWGRHIVDSAQLAPLVNGDSVLDVGSGAGFPGLVLAIIDDRPITLTEPRRLRADFLATAAIELGLETVTVRQVRCERLTAPPFGSIVARAVAPLETLLGLAEHLADSGTTWVMAKGRNAQSELAVARETWHGDFRMVNSVTDPAAAIIVATNVRRKAWRGR